MRYLGREKHGLVSLGSVCGIEDGRSMVYMCVWGQCELSAKEGACFTCESRVRVRYLGRNEHGLRT